MLDRLARDHRPMHEWWRGLFVIRALAHWFEFSHDSRVRSTRSIDMGRLPQQ